MSGGIQVSIVKGGRAGRRLTFDQERITIGRLPDNDVALDPDADRQASGRHAELRRIEGGYVLLDLGSTNGTYLAGQRVEHEVPVADGTRIELGRNGPVLQVHLAAPAGRTAIYRAMVVDTIRRSTRHYRWALLGVGALLVVGVVLAWTLLDRQQAETETLRREAEAARAEQRRLSDETLALADRLRSTEQALTGARDNLAGTAARLADLRLQIDASRGEARQTLEAQAAELERVRQRYEGELRRQEKEVAALKRTGSAAQEIAQKYERSLFMLMADTPGRLVGFCTAFSVSALGLLATNAHCVRAIEDLDGRGVRALARMNRAPDRTYQVVRWKRHGGWDGTASSPDVALIELDLKGDLLPSAAVLASDAKVQKLAAGQPIYTMGFPGRVMNEARPAADFRAAVISRLTDFQNQPAPAATAQMVWHSALTSKGTSGSPIFDADGEVIAVNNGGLSARRVLTQDSDTGLPRADVAYDATGLNFGVRVDALRVLLGR